MLKSLCGQRVPLMEHMTHSAMFLDHGRPEEKLRGYCSHRSALAHAHQTMLCQGCCLSQLEPAQRSKGSMSRALSTTRSILNSHAVRTTSCSSSRASLSCCRPPSSISARELSGCCASSGLFREPLALSVRLLCRLDLLPERLGVLMMPWLLSSSNSSTEGWSDSMSADAASAGGSATHQVPDDPASTCKPAVSRS